eukprot:35319-Eustigmatos_ZCMA.PRE.1
MHCRWCRCCGRLDYRISDDRCRLVIPYHPNGMWDNPEIVARLSHGVLVSRYMPRCHCVAGVVEVEVSHGCGDYVDGHNS